MILVGNTEPGDVWNSLLPFVKGCVSRGLGPDGSQHMGVSIDIAKI